MGRPWDTVEMDELTDDQVAELKQALLALQDELRGLLASTREGSKPIDLDEPIGRLTRMDAIQQQKMTAAHRRSFEVRLEQVKQALGFVERGEYGECRKCEEPIGYPRLSARPESPFCVACQDAIDRGTLLFCLQFF